MDGWSELLLDCALHGNLLETAGHDIAYISHLQ